jgi:hypothetical protein
MSNTNIGGNQLQFAQKLFQFYDESNPLLSTVKNTFTEISLYPNPTKNRINIDITAPIKTVCIFNNLGKEVFKSTINKQQIDISNLTKGIYFIRIDINTTKSYYKKIVKL